MSPSVEEIGSLRSVVGAYALSPEGRDPQPRFDEYALRFEKQSIVITAEPLDDTVRVLYGEASRPFQEDLTARAPWEVLNGCGVIWTWILTIQRGYADGFQIELAQPGECWSLQFMCEGAALSVRSIGPVERLWNQFEQGGR